MKFLALLISFITTVAAAETCGKDELVCLPSMHSEQVPLNWDKIKGPMVNCIDQAGKIIITTNFISPISEITKIQYSQPVRDLLTKKDTTISIEKRFDTPINFEEIKSFTKLQNFSGLPPHVTDQIKFDPMQPYRTIASKEGVMLPWYFCSKKDVLSLGNEHMELMAKVCLERNWKVEVHENTFKSCSCQADKIDYFELAYKKDDKIKNESDLNQVSAYEKSVWMPNFQYGDQVIS